MAAVTVTQVRGSGFRVETRGHAVLVDQPSDGVELGPTPVELLVRSLASCAAHYAAGHLRRQGLPSEGLRVDARWGMRIDPPRVNRVELIITPPVHLEQLPLVDRTAPKLVVHRHLRGDRRAGGQRFDIPRLRVDQRGELFDIGEIPQGRDAASGGARADGDQHRGLLTDPPDPFGFLGGADRSLHNGHIVWPSGSDTLVASRKWLMWTVSARVSNSSSQSSRVSWHPSHEVNFHTASFGRLITAPGP